ncbi:hypothetical protein PInf_008955 [Phytophthora infestans]|nr:hypothetical protein PInf_008955 [Phytophthora infestans]
MRANSDAPADATATPFNPLVALQTLLSADVMSVKQRIKAAQQLEEYFRLLSPTPGLLLSYEPYLPLLTDVMVTPIKGGQELQTSVLAMLQILSAHNPTGFGDWIARNAQLGNEPWLVQWSYALLLQTEKIVPREEDGEKWEDSSAEFKQFDMVFARVMQMWRTLLDHTAEVALVDQLVKCLQALPLQTGTDQWRTLMLKKLQAHFVDIADVLIGWMMSTGPHSPLREEILTLLDNFGRLWADNSVFSLQLMNSFADPNVFLISSRLHDCEVTKLSTVLENACKLASTNFSRIADPLLERAAVIGVLDDDIPSRIVKKGGQPKRVKVMELSRNPERLKLLDDDTTHVIAILDLISTKLEKQNQRHRQLKVSPRQLCLVLKMACAFIGAVSKWIIDRSDALETLNGVSLRMLQLALGMLPSETVVARDHRLSVETLHVVHALLSRTTLLPVIPRESCRGLLIKVTQVVRSSSVKVRESCIQVLEVFQARMEACEFAGETFDVLLDLLLDPSPIVKRRIMSGALNEVALAALLKQEKLRTYGHISRPLHPSFVGADFANILSRFQSRECDESEWNRVCRSIMNRTSPHVAINNSGILLGAIRQAAAWCVQNRLRTHFGGPAQSFASIERLLQEYADEIQQRNHTELPLALNGKQLPNWLMLEFVNALEMCITSAICTTDMDQSNPESEEYKAVVFFRTNKVVCDDWLNRIRPFLVEMAKNAPNYELWRYHSHAAMTICYSRLSRAMSSFAAHGPSDKIVTELRQAEKELDAALFMLCRCHCDAKDADSIIGIQRWSESVASALIRLYQQNKGRVETGEEYCKLPLFRWLSALRYEAEMRYEEAAAEYESLLEPVLTREGFEAVSPAKLFESPMTNLRISPSALLGCFKQHAKCYAALRQWTKLRQLVTQFVSVANSLMDYDYPIEEIQSIFDCSDAWSSEIGTISNLEALTDRSNDVKDSRATRVAQALRVWDVVSEANTGQRSAESLESAHKCFQAAIAVSPKSPKAWAHYSHWCYERGKREVEQISEQNGYIHLDSEDEAQISTLLDEIGIVESDRDSVIRAFCHFLDNDELFSQRHDTLQQLCTELAPQDHSRDAVDRLTELQQACHSKALRFHTLAARGYGKYLSVLFSDSGCSISRQEITMVVLRLLGLLTTYGAEREVVAALEDVFSDGPVDPWSHVIPQLIARAHHPISAVSSLVCLILKRLAHHSPHSIVYPVVVDSMEPHATFSSPQEERGTASNTFATVLQELQNVSAGQVEGVRLLIFELRRISILWDEAWISTLVKLSADVSRRTSTLEKEANRVEKNASLSAKEKSELAQRKLVAIMKPIYVSIERLWKETCGGIREQHTVTPHERKFLKEFGGVIDKAMENFRHCCASESWGNAGSVKNPEELWQPFAEILKALMNATGRREQLPLHDISPAMASTSRQLALTNMPGAVVGKTAGQVEPITIHRVDASVTVLRTKTKPKSLELIGSDGKTYKYLLKAREDLRLDERIMQYLRVTNQFLQADDAAAARDLSAQSYSVIPLSRNAGLIQMVPDVVPLFQVYTARNDASGRTPQDPVAASSAQQPPPPTAQFYAKLKQHGITNVAPNNRSLWPPNVLRQVYQELVAQRPRNVLQQKILLRSEDLRESWIKSTRLSKSLAVMSVLGYIVGLGDRHLDNILLCVNSGDIVHIDHNVCFDKGRRLKVPEIVPFRLTPMLQDALGFTGVEGRFRMAFETTLRIVRSDNVREALLTLFEAFVYGPLVDWIAEDRRQGRSGDLKARLEVNVNLSLFLSRAEERRQDTISFGRQYEQHADVISRALNGSQVPFETLLEQRKQLLSLEVEEQTRLREVASVEAELSKHQSAEQIKRAEFESTTTRFNDITTKVSSFADECLARHQQIEVWRQKSVAFAESDPVTQLSAVTTAVDTLSFQTVHETLCSVMEKLRSVGRQRQLLDALESNCRSVDADVARLRFEIEKIATYLVPYLSYYGYQRKELDAYLESEVKVAGKDVYFKWWSVCSEYLRGLAGEQNKGTANTIVTCSAPSKENVAESTMVLNRLSDLPLYLNAQSNEEKETSCISQADQLLEDVSNALSAMKLSNAQGQRLMKLAGASWIIEVMEQLNDESCVSNAEYIFTPALKAPARFGVVVAVTQACSTLLDLVSTPKGSMKRLRASELLASQRDKSMDGFNEILQEVGSFAVVLQEEFVSNVYGRQMDECGDLLERVKVMRTTPDGRKVLGMVLASTSAVKDTHSSIEVMLAKFPAVRSLLTAGFAVTQKISSLVDSLYQLSVLSGEEVERIKSSSSASWIELVLIIAELYTGTDEDKVEKVRTIWSSHVDGFVSNCLVKLLRYQLASVISSEWKFDFCALDESTSKLQTRWADYFCSQIPDILPSTLANLSTATPESQTNDVTKSVAELMSVCEEWWTYQWSKSQAHAWTQRVSSIRIRHAGRLRYAAWLSATMPAQGDAASLSRTQLLAFLSSQVPQLNALLTDQVTVEASVLELAQQLDYLASNMGDASDESLHTCVQSCYGNVAGLFDYGRTLADLVQGISVIETSSMPDTEKIQLEVDVVGTNILQSASTATLEMQSMHEEVKKMTTHVQELQGNLKQKKTMYDALASRKRAVETEFHSFCTGNMDAVLKITRVLSKSIKEMRLLLMGFDKAKTPSKQSQVAAGTIRARDSLSPERPASNVMAGFSFMENDRLVQILLRSIRSVNHLQQLEGVLEKHGDLCASLRGAVIQLDRALRDFDTQADQLLAGNNQGVDVHESSRVYLLLQLLLDLIEALRVVKDESPLAEDTPMLLIKARDLEKSQYGLQVLKRIEEKLSGTVTDMADAPLVLTVEQQASWLIDEATKTDNLCVMYEGWTPWI